MADLFSRCALFLVPRFAVGLIRIWFGTCTLNVRGDAAIWEHAAHDTGIAAFWHYSFLYFFYYFRKFPSAIMVSASKDGEYIAQVAQLLGHVPVRGSSNRGGVKALRKMIDLLQQGRNSAIVADGSQGPARKVQAGCILMAGKSGKPIFPMAWAANRCLVFKSWDRTVVPLPFATIFLHHGEPLFVPPSLSSAQIEAYRLELENRLNGLYEEVWLEAGRPHERSVPRKNTVDM